MANEKRLKTCGDCIHADICQQVNGGWFSPQNPAYCKAFKGKNDFVEVDDMKEFAEDVAYQFGYYCQNGGRLHITHGGLSTLEWAFDILGWENPHPVPECECEIEGCHEHATCGTPTADGYKRMCGKHYRNHGAKMDGDGNE